MTSDAWVVTMPKLGETVTEGTVNAWLKSAGDTVAFDDPLFEVSTDKVDSEIPSPYDGTIIEILVQAGETVPVGTPLVRIGEPGAAGGESGGGTAESSAEQAGYAGADEGVVTEPTPAQDGHVGTAGQAPTSSSSSVAASPSSVELHEVTMPKLGETVTEGTVNAWLKAVGDTVA